MTRLILLVFSLMILPAWASNQDHTCQGGHNCNQGGSDGTVDIDVDASAGAIAGSKSDADASATGGEATATSEGGSANTTNNLSIFDLGGNGEGGDGEVGGTSTSGEVDGLAAGTSILSPSTSVTTTTTNKYKEAPRAYAGTASGPKDIDCRTILGFDFRGATEDGAGGATFGVPLGERKDCKYERQAARAFAKGDLERGWANHCMSPTNIEVTTMVARVVYDEQLDTDGAFKRCMLNAQLEVPGDPKT